MQKGGWERRGREWGGVFIVRGAIYTCVRERKNRKRLSHDRHAATRCAAHAAHVIVFIPGTRRASRGNGRRLNHPR